MYPQSQTDPNYKIQKLRKHILHDMLKYNLQQSNQRREQARINYTIEQQQANDIISKQQEYLKRENNQRRLNLIERRRYLRDQYEREIQEKRKREARERESEKVYAKLERDYVEASNQRRLRDIQRMYNRQSFKATINNRDSLSLSRKHANPYINQGPNNVSSNKLSQRDNYRYKTQPIDMNPQYQQANGYPQRHHYQGNPEGQQSPNKSNNNGRKYQSNLPLTPHNRGGYEDSLDRVQVPVNGNKFSQQQLPNINNNLKMANQIQLNLGPGPGSSPNNGGGINNGSPNANVNKNLQSQVIKSQQPKTGNNAIFRPPGGSGNLNNNFRINY